MFGINPKETPHRQAKGFNLDGFLSTFSNCINTVASAGESILDYNSQKKHLRRTDTEISKDTSGTDKSPYDFQCCKGILLKNAVKIAGNTPGVYVLYLDGMVMKCGRASFGQGVAWRLRQYYNLKYDNSSRAGDYWSINKENRDRVTVSWQCCPACKCDELESKLFQKYGKGDWAKRAPVYTSEDTWELLI